VTSKPQTCVYPLYFYFYFFVLGWMICSNTFIFNNNKKKKNKLLVGLNFDQRWPNSHVFGFFFNQKTYFHLKIRDKHPKNLNKLIFNLKTPLNMSKYTKLN
jgi:hypothetical protein